MHRASAADNPTAPLGHHTFDSTHIPSALKSAYSPHPVSFHVFFRLRPPAGSMGRMWNMRMSQPMAGQGMAMPMNHPMP
jgi:hypothetical protein